MKIGFRFYGQSLGRTPRSGMVRSSGSFDSAPISKSKLIGSSRRFAQEDRCWGCWRERNTIVAALRSRRQGLGALVREAGLIMPRAANAFGKRQLAVRAPGKKPGLHVLMPDVVSGLDLPVCLAQLRQHLSLHVMGRACVRHEHILTPGSGFTENTKCGFRDSALVELPEAAWCDKNPRDAKGSLTSLGISPACFAQADSGWGKQKVPPSYSRAGKNARSLNGRRDDEQFIGAVQTVPLPGSVFAGRQAEGRRFFC